MSNHHQWRLMVRLQTRICPEKGCRNGIFAPKDVEINGPSPTVSNGG